MTRREGTEIDANLKVGYNVREAAFAKRRCR